MSVNTELTFHLLRYSAQRLAEDNLKALFGLGFSLEEIQALEPLTIKELIHLSQLGEHFLDVNVNHQRFVHSLQHVRRETAGEALQNELLRRRAPAEMMAALFGMTPLQYANRRKLLGLFGIGVGRPALPDEHMERAILEAWQQHAQFSDGERFLATARETQLPLSVIWPLLHASETGKLPGNADDCRTEVDLAPTGKPSDAGVGKPTDAG